MIMRDAYVHLCVCWEDITTGAVAFGSTSTTTVVRVRAAALCKRGHLSGGFGQKIR